MESNIHLDALITKPRVLDRHAFEVIRNQSAFKSHIFHIHFIVARLFQNGNSIRASQSGVLPFAFIYTFESTCFNSFILWILIYRLFSYT